MTDPPAVNLTVPSPMVSSEEEDERGVVTMSKSAAEKVVEDEDSSDVESISEPEVTPEEEKQENSEALNSNSSEIAMPPPPVAIQRGKKSSKAKRMSYLDMQAVTPTPRLPPDEPVKVEKPVVMPQRASYSKEILKPTKEVVESQSEGQSHKPAYINKGKQLKAVIRDPAPSQVDPNANLGEMYKRKSIAMKPTGFGEKLKQGQDVATTASKNTTAPAYASVSLKKAAKPIEKQKKGKTAPSGMPAVKLHKAAPIVKENPRRSSLPEVQLQKTAPVVKETKHFDLPSEFSEAKNKLKRRTERPWYSNGVPDAQPGKKWFFQRGEWSDGSTPKKTAESPKSWFFSASPKSTTSTTAINPTYESSSTSVYRGNKTLVLTGKDKVNVQHFNELGTETNKKSLKTTVNKQYYKDLQRRRQGLPPKARRGGLLWRILFWCFMVVPLAIYVGNTVFPEQMDTVWDQAQPVIQQVRHHTDPIVEQVQPHVDAIMEKVHPFVLEHVQPRVVALMDQAHPRVCSAVDRICSPVEAYAVPEDNRLVEMAHSAGVSICTELRSTLESATEEGDAFDSTLSEVEAHSRSRKRVVQKQERVAKKENEKHCECDSQGPKWVSRLVPGGNKDRRPECCSKNNKAEL